MESFLGVTIKDLDRGRGIIVLNHKPGAPYDLAKGADKDIILSWNDTEINNKSDWDRLCKTMKPTDTVLMAIRRNVTDNAEEAAVYKDLALDLEVGMASVSMDEYRRLKRLASGLVDKSDLPEKFGELLTCDVGVVQEKLAALDEEIRKRLLMQSR